MVLPEIFAAFRWWLALLLLGYLALPLTYVLFEKLPDRGYAFSKLLGLLLASYVFWMAGSVGFLGNNMGGILFSLAAVALSALWFYRRSRRSALTLGGSNETREAGAGTLSDWLSRNRTQVLITELLFASLFFLWVWVRAQNPAISATEKPMEFAFLNAVGRSPNFPPVDPWLSGFAISYYYFGYVMTSLLARLAMVPEQIAFNLAIAWLVAGAGTGAYGLVYNLLRVQGARSAARVLGLIAAIALVLGGNLIMGLEIAHANGVGSAQLWRWLDVRDLDEAPQPEMEARYLGTNWWWWRASRPIREYHLSGRPEEGLEPIAEFPSFSFVLGDLHPHVLALPFAFLSLGLALTWWLPGGKSGLPPPGETMEWPDRNWAQRAQSLLRSIGWPLGLFSALLLGGLAFLNTWDVLIHLFILLGALVLARWRDEGWSAHLLVQAAFVGASLLVAVIILYLPFFLGFRSQAGAPYLLPMLMRPTRLLHFLIIFGMPLLAIIIFLIALAVRQRFRYWQSAVLTAVLLIFALLLVALLFGFLVAITVDGAGRVQALANELGLTLPPRPEQAWAPGWGVSALIAILPHYLGARFTYPALTFLMAALAGIVVMIWRKHLGERSSTDQAPDHKAKRDALPFVLLLIVTGVLLTIGPEFVFLRDNFGARLNTIFKFYYQAWVLFGVSALYALGYLWLGWQGAKRVVPATAMAGYAILLVVALLFPIYAVNSRAQEYRGPHEAAQRLPATLNGLAQMERFNPADYAAVQWLRDHVSGVPVVLEAVGGQYTGFGRISAGTGLPTVLGWPGHEYQWRGDTPEPAIREPAVRDIYTSPEIENVADLLDFYSIRYIVVGGLERDAYGVSGIDKFAESLAVAFESDGVTIYHWQPR